MVEAMGRKDLQLLRDVNTRWSSTLLMIERALILREVGLYLMIQLSHLKMYLQAIDKFLKNNDFKELHKYRLKMAEWEVLATFKSILQVKFCNDYLI